MEPLDIFLMIINVAFTSFAVIIIKLSGIQQSNLKKYAYLLFSMGIYVLMSFITVYMYSKYSLFLIQALLTFTYLLSPILAILLLKEKVDLKAFWGIAFIMAGIILVGYGQRL